MGAFTISPSGKRLLRWNRKQNFHSPCYSQIILLNIFIEFCYFALLQGGPSDLGTKILQKY